MKKYAFVLLAAFLLSACDDDSNSKDTVCKDSSCSSQQTGGGTGGQTGTDPSGSQTGTESGTGSQTGTNPGGGSELSGGTTGRCGAHESCADGYLCYDNLCKDDEGVLQGAECGNSVCKATEVCINKACKDRSTETSYSLNGMCNPNTFVERCVGNKVVYCATDNDQTTGDTVTLIREADCSETEGYSCHVKAEGNYAFCAKQEPACTGETAGRMSYCRIEKTVDGEIYAGAVSYEAYYDCEPDTKGEFIAFMDENLETADCTGVCLNEYVCESVTQNTGCKQNTCRGNILNYCYEDGSSYSMNCEDHGTTCIEKDGTADCDWDNASYDI